MKKVGLVIIFLLMLPLAGCIQKSNISEAKSDAVAEYMAGLILKYDRNYDQELVTEDELSDSTVDEVTTAQTPSPALTHDNNTTANSNGTSVDTSNTSTEANSNFTLTQVVGNNDFDINYKDYNITNSYPEDAENAYFSLSPRDGYQLLVISFTAKNTAGSNKRLNLSKEDILYKLDVNDGTFYKPLLTLLENDLQYIDLTVGSGKTKKVLLIFEVSSKDDLSKIKLTVMNGDKSNIIKIK